MSKGDMTRTHDWPSFRQNFDAIDWGGQENGRREGVPEKAESSPGDSPSPPLRTGAECAEAALKRVGDLAWEYATRTPSGEQDAPKSLTMRDIYNEVAAG